MSPTGRITRGSLAVAEELGTLSSRDRLIFAQAVYEYGARQSAWNEIAKLLAKHPLISKPKNYFTAQSCASIYSHLMKEAGIECTDLCEAKKSPLNAQLARCYYSERIIELKDAIAAGEKRFKTLVQEIDDIRSGKWDGHLTSDKSMTPGNVDVNIQVVETSIDELNPPESASSIPTDKGKTDDVSAEEPGPESTEGEGLKASESIEEEQEGDIPTPSSVVPEISIPKSPKRPKRSRIENLRNRHKKSEDQAESQPRETEENLDEDSSGAALDGDTHSPQEDISAHTSPNEGHVSETRSRGSTAEPLERRGGKRRASETDPIYAREKKRLREESEPMDDAESPATPTTAGYRSTKDSKERKRFQGVIGMVHSQISSHRNGTIFHHPIRPADAPDYHDIVKRPMDLKTIKNRVRDGIINNSSEYQRDIYLMFANSLMYNRPNSDIYLMAEEMMHDSEGHIQNLQQSEAFTARSRV